MSKTYVGIKLQDLGLYNTLDPKDKIVIVKDKDEGVLQLKDFFLYVQSNLDLSNYYTSTQADTIFMAKVDAYTRKDADVKFALVEKTYTRTQSDTRFALASDTFNKAEIEGKYASKEQMYTKDLVYTKEESITAFALKTEIPIMPDLTPYSTTAKGDLRWALKVDVFSKTEADARFANINNYYTKSESDNKYALLSNTYTKAETDNKFLDTTEAYTKDYINLNIYTKTQVYTKAETDGKYPLKTDVYTVTAVNDQFAAKSWVYSRAEADNTFRKLADSYNRAEVNALIDASKSGLSTDVSNSYYTKTDADNKFELKGTAYNKIDSDAKYALISNSISPSQVAAKYYNKTEIDKSLGDAATNTSNLFALKSAAVGGVSLTPTNLTFTKVDGTSSLVAIPTWNQSTTGNAATATKLQTTRAISLTGAVTAAGVNFDGSANISINATSLDATKLTGIVPNASITGTYTNVSLDISKNIIYTVNNTDSNESSGTVFGLASIRAYGAPTGAVIVIKTSIPSAAGNVVSLQLKGLSDSETSTIDMVLSGYTLGSISKLSLGTKDYDVRKATSSDGFLCFLISHPSGNLGISTALSVVYAHVNYLVNINYYRNWTIYYTTDLTTFTNISDYCPQKTSVVNTYWNNIQGKPTTVAGYGITDVYTKSEIYTKTESDNRFSYKQESIKSATLNTSTLSFTKADNTVSNISIPTWNQDTSGNSATATKLKTPRTINGVSFDGSSNITTPAYTSLYSLEYRGIKPYQVTTAAMSTYFVDRGRMELGEDTYNYNDLVVFNSWTDPSGGNLNALLFGKSVGQGIWHYFTGQNSTTWGTAKQLAYTDSNITGNAASASKWLTARTFNITGDASWSASVDGSSDITGTLTLANTGVNPGTYTKVTVDSKGRTTAASNLVPADIPNLDMSKVNTGVLGISQGGTAATTAAAARTNLGLGTSAVLNVGAVNGVASLDASGKVPTSQLYINNTLTSTDTTVPLTAAQGKVLNDSLGITNTNLQTLTNRLDTNYYLKSDVFTKTEITTNYFDKTYVNNNFLAQAANKDVSIAGFINASKDILFTTSLTGIKWNMNTDMASIFFKNNGDDDSDSYLGFDVGDNGDEYFRWSFNASSSNKIAMSLRRDKLEINNNVATLGLSTSATLADITRIPQYGIYSKGNIKTDGQIITNATSHHVNISDLATGNDSPIRIPEYSIPMGQTGYIPFIHGSVLTNTNGYTMHSSLGLYRANNTWWDGGMYMAIGGDDRYPTAAFRFKLDGTIDFTGGGVSLAGNASSATKLQTARTISLTGDGSWSTNFDGSGNSTGTFVLSNSGVSAGSYTKVTVDSKGRVTSGTGLLAGDIPVLDTSKLTSGNLPIARGGTGAGDSATARTNLGLGTAATRNVGTNSGDVITVGSFGFGSSVSAGYDDSMATGDVPAGFFRYADSSAKKPPMVSTYDVFGISIPRHGGSTGGLLWFPYHVSDTQRIVYQSHYPGQTRYHVLYTDQNTPNEDVTVKSLTVKNLSGGTDNAPNIYYHTDGKLYKANQPALLKSQADTYYSPINLNKLSAPDTRYSGHVKPNTIPVKALSVAFADINASFGINNGYPWADVIVLNTWEEPSGGNPNAIITSRGGQQGIWHAYGPFNGSAWSSVKQIAYTDSNITGNASTATKLQNSRYFNIIGAAAADPVYFDGTNNASLNVTALDATKLLGRVPKGSLSADYTFDFTMTNTNGRFIKYGNTCETYYGLLNHVVNIDPYKGYIVIKTLIPKTKNAMNIVQLQVNESYWGAHDNITVQWYRSGGWVGTVRTSNGNKEVPVALAVTPDDMIAIVLGNNAFEFAIPSIHIPWCTAHYGYDGTNYKGWTVEVRSDLNGYTEVQDLVNKESVAAVNWSKVGSKPTTLAGYGITDAWSSTGSDNRYVMLGESRAISLNNSVTARKLSLNRSNGPGGILWYSEGYTAWQDYMSAPGDGNGFAANITAPSGQLVTSWAKRSFIETSTGYGWTFESGSAYSTTPTVVAEIRSSDGSARFGGGITAGGDISVGAKLNVTTMNSPGAFSFLNASNAQQIMTGGLLASPDYSHIARVPSGGIYSYGDIATNGDIRMTKSLSSLRWDMNTDYAKIYFKNDSDSDSNSYLGFEVGDNGDEHFKWFSSNDSIGSKTEWMNLRSTGLNLNTDLTVGGNTTLNTARITRIYSSGDIDFTTDATATAAQRIRTGGILVSNSWAHAGYVPPSGIWVLGDIVSNAQIASNGGFRFPNRTWNPVGYDAFIGDFDRAGCLCIKAQNTTTKAGIAFFDDAGTELTKLWSRTSDIYIEKGLVVENIVYAKGFNSIDAGALPASRTAIGALQSYFTTYGGLANASVGGAYGDFLSINTYKDESGGKQNGLFFGKSEFRMYHFQTTFGNTGAWGAGRPLAYLDETVNTSGGTINSGYLRINSGGNPYVPAPLVITGSGIQSWGVIKIAANNDDTSATEPVIITSAKGHDPSADQGLSVYPNVVNFFGSNNWWNSSGNVNVSGTVTAGSSISNRSSTCAWLINTNADYHSDSLHKFRTMGGTPQKVGAGGLLVSDSFDKIGRVPADGIYSQGNVLTDSSLVGYRIGVNNTSSSSGQGISLYGGAVDGVPSYGLMFAGTSTFGTHGGVSGDWATYFTMTSGAQRGWIFRNLDVGNIASISSLGVATFAGTVTANGVRTTDIVISSTANIASGTVSGNLTVPDQSIISADGLAVNTSTANTKIRYALDYSPATAAAWINFSYMYDSTAGTNVITVKSSYNISNITRIGTGIYKVEFLRGFENEHFVMSGYARDDDTGGDVIIGQQSGQVFTSTTAVFSVASGSGRSMPTSAVCTVLFFGKRYGGAWLL